MSSASVTVDIVIVNWNAGRHLQACLTSLAESECTGFLLGDVVIVDNDSSDDSLDGLDARGLPLRVVRNAGNRGFGAACNQGAAFGHGGLVLFLNPDAVLLPEALDRAVRALLTSPKALRVAVAGARLIGETGRVTSSCSRFPSFPVVLWKMLGLSLVWPQVFRPQAMPPDETDHSQVVDQIIGAFFLIRRAVFEELGGFDERFFLYYEEVDLSLRLRESGWTSYYVHDAVVQHKGRVSSDQVPARRLLYSLRSRSQFAHKHWPRWQAVTLDVLTVGLEGAIRLIAALARRQRRDVADTFWALRRYLDFLRDRDLPPGDGLERAVVRR